MQSGWIDITFPLSDKLPAWPGSIGIRVTQVMQMPHDPNNLTAVALDCHLGTHLDAPLHFVENGRPVDQLDLEKCIGKAYVAEIYGKRSITAADLDTAGIPDTCTRLLLKTDNQVYWQQGLLDFREDFCSIDLSGARWVLERGIVLLGIDYLSIQRFHDSREVHCVLLGAEVVVVETLDLSAVSQGWYDLICLPIKLEGLEGAPVRAVLRKSAHG
jgi:arylformamidase